jgi:hypothetical protein
MRAHRVRALLMGGQACVFYGAAQFSRDTDFAILADAGNLLRLRRALADLRAEVIAVPPFAMKYLRAGLAIHFRCRHPEAWRMRVDVMAKMRGVEPFAKLWRRRTSIELPDGTKCDLLSLPDLVQAKKTQRNKDWPMIQRLVESHYYQHRDHPTAAHLSFCLLELRTAELLIEIACSQTALCCRLFPRRPLLAVAAGGVLEELEKSLRDEEVAERERDKLYWQPLRRELEKLRHALLKSPNH